MRRVPVLAVLALSIIGCARGAPDPTYDGRRLSDWVQDLKFDDPAKHDGVHRAILQAGEQAVPHLLSLITAGDARTRVNALAELDSVCCDKTATLPELRPLLKDADARVRVSAARSVSLIEGQASPEVLQVLVTALASEDSFVSWSAAWTLKRLGPKAAGATEALAGALKHRHQDTRLAAAIALGEIGPGAVAAVPALEETLGGQDQALKGNATVALRAIRGK